MKLTMLLAASLLTVSVLSHAESSFDTSTDKVTAICFMTNSNLFRKDNMPNVPVSCYTANGVKKYKNLIAVLKDDWKPLSIGVGHGDGTTKAVKVWDGQTYEYRDMQSVGIIMEKTIN